MFRLNCILAVVLAIGAASVAGDSNAQCPSGVCRRPVQRIVAAAPVRTVAKAAVVGAARVSASAVRASAQVAAAPVRAARHAACRVREHRHARRAHGHGRRVVLFPRIRFFPG